MRHFPTVLPNIASHIIKGDVPQVRARCKASGITLAPMDLMIAAHAKALDLASAKVQDSTILVTRDQVFNWVPDGLKLENWAAAAAR